MDANNQQNVNEKNQDVQEQEQNQQNVNTENQPQQTITVVQEKKPGIFKRARQKGKEDIKRATEIEDGSVIKAVIDLWRMLFPKK